MTNYVILITGYLLIFVSLILAYSRLKKTNITNEDLIYWQKFEKSIDILKNNLLKLIKVSEGEIIYLWRNLIEKFLLRIKIFGLKIETWAGKKLEKMKSNDNSLTR